MDYTEGAYARGQLPEGRSLRDKIGDEQVLCARSIDRCIRPLFPPGFNFETHVRGSALCMHTHTHTHTHTRAPSSSLCFLCPHGALVPPVPPPPVLNLSPLISPKPLFFRRFAPKS